MASLPILIAIAVVAIAVPQALATEYVVGDDDGWLLDFDYQAWAKGKEFRVGDKLIFNYPQGAHNVFRVDGTAFQQCAPPATSEALTSGSDVITLATPGRKWYICGVGKHCASGNMKLAITVLPPMESPASAPSAISPSSATGITFSKHHALAVGIIGVLMMIMV
ncbi:blue copper protein 1b-like [Actinidia eriantha]|uniref:blue copper protein 1b-like n=1 Tax=Actinidia eriantha TaxID=165200 RepID=UPI0025830A31|nr:blue copper protein 1b-like [Actinidia eriantha]